MLLGKQLPDSVQILNRQSSGDPRGDRTYTWPDSATPVRGQLQPTAAQEVTTGIGTTVTSDWLLILDPAATIDAYARVKVNGRRFDVVGEPARLGGNLAHVEARLVAVS